MKNKAIVNYRNTNFYAWNIVPIQTDFRESQIFLFITFRIRKRLGGDRFINGNQLA